MLGYILVGFLAAYGLFSALWTIFGWVLPGGEGCAVVCYGSADEGILARYQWLRGAGFLQVPLLAVEAETDKLTPGMEICSREELLPRLERERNRIHGTGNGDYTGRHQRRGLSEL